jgi:hypothetical protein
MIFTYKDRSSRAVDLDNLIVLVSEVRMQLARSGHDIHIQGQKLLSVPDLEFGIG